MRNLQITCCVWAVAVVAASMCFFYFVDFPVSRYRYRNNPGDDPLILQGGGKEASDSETRHDGDRKKSAAPFVFAPEHIRGVKTPPPAGRVADNVRAAYREMSKNILERWGPEYEHKLFRGAMAWSDGGRVVEDKLLNAVLEQDSFVAAFTGDSITAGHDCLYEQSYPVVLNATMGRLMAAAGVRYTAINVAMGNTRVTPYSYCVDAHAGLDADIVSWSFDMEIANAPCAEAAAAIELFIRSATVLPRRPAVLVMDARPDQEIKALRAIAARNKRFLGHCRDSRRSLVEVYRDFGLHNIFVAFLVGKHTVGDSRFDRETLYKAGKHYPFPMSWHPGPVSHELVADMLFMHYGKVFLSAIDRLEEAAPGLTAAQLRQKRRRTHDPQREDAAAQSSSDGMTMITLRKAVGLGPDNKNVFTNHQDEDQDQDESLGAHNEGSQNDCTYMGGGRGYGVLPPAEWCDEPHCVGAGNYRCANTFYPLAGNQGSRLLDMVVPAASEGGGERDLINRDGKHLLVTPAENRWAVTLNEASPKAINYLENVHAPDGFHKPIDTKWVLVGDAASGPIEFEFVTHGVPGEGEENDYADRAACGQGNMWGNPPTAVVQATVGEAAEAANVEATAAKEAVGAEPATAAAVGLTDSRVAVCKPYFIDRVEFSNTTGVRFSVDGVETSVVEAGRDGLATPSCVFLAAEIGPGRHRLRVEPLIHGGPLVAISHVIYPA